MPKCPFAAWKPISGNVGPYTSGPFKIVHHTTEGSTASGAFDAFKKNKSDPHFTVDSSNIYQHIDTSMSARSLKNKKGGVQTNKDSALQIEVVGFAHKAKNGATLNNVARLCRWLESTHGVPQTWPNGPTKPATSSGKDPGGHNRNPGNWEKLGGHYGHCHVPENDHWDPGYTKSEIAFLMEAEFSREGELLYAEAMSRFTELLDRVELLDGEQSTMPDHDDLEFDEYDIY